MEGLTGEVLQTPSSREDSATDKVRGRSSKCFALYLYVYTYIHTCILMHVCVCVCMCACACVCSGTCLSEVWVRGDVEDHSVT